MLEHYFHRPATVDRLRALWLGPAIDRYAEWLSDRQVSRASSLLMSCPAASSRLGGGFNASPMVQPTRQFRCSS